MLKSNLMYALAVSLSLALAPSAKAVTWNEAGDAGELLSTAQVPTGVGSLDSISGTLIDLGGGVDDIDLFKIFINDPANFSVTVTASLSFDNDAQLFLFNSAGNLVLFNDDVDGPLFIQLPQFNAGELAGAADNYFLGFNLYGTQPNSDPLTGWNRFPFPFQTGPYTLNLTGASFAQASVPEPSSVALMSLGLAGFGFLRRRNRGRRAG